jgi:hypothetical protein
MVHEACHSMARVVRQGDADSTAAMDLLFTVGFASVDPTPGFWSQKSFTIMQTLEFTLHVEGPFTSDTTGTWILYGWPTLVHTWSPEELQGTCAGL